MSTDPPDNPPLRSIIKKAWFPRFDKETLTKAIVSGCENAQQQFPNKVYLYSHLYFDLPDSLVHQVTSLGSLSKSIFEDSVFFCYADTDDELCLKLKEVKDRGGKVRYFPLFQTTRYAYTNRNAVVALDRSEQLADKVEKWEFNSAQNLIQGIELTRDVPGDYVEIGVFRGASAVTALHYMKQAGIQRSCFFMDTFDGFNYDEALHSFDNGWHAGHSISPEGSQGAMRWLDTEVLGPIGVPYTLVEANICTDELPDSISQIAMCNIDVDLYEATLAALLRVAPLISRRGLIICEDPAWTPALGGALMAMNEFLDSTLGKDFMKIFLGSQYFLIKT